VVSAWLDQDDGEGDAELKLVVEVDFDGVESGFLEAETAEDVNVRRVGVHLLEVEVDVKFREFRLVVGSDDEGALAESPLATAPAGPEAEFEERDGQ
jgi:hypothetical protein